MKTKPVKEAYSCHAITCLECNAVHIVMIGANGEPFAAATLEGEDAMEFGRDYHAALAVIASRDIKAPTVAGPEALQ